MNQAATSDHHEAIAHQKEMFGSIVAFVAVLFLILSICSYRNRLPEARVVGAQQTVEESARRKSFVKKNVPIKAYERDYASDNYSGRRKAPQEAPLEEEHSAERMDVPSELDEKGGDLCSICLINFSSGEEISWSTNEGCPHTFHKDCISEWLYKHMECPMCRKVFLSDCAKHNDDAKAVCAGDQDLESGNAHPGLQDTDSTIIIQSSGEGRDDNT